MPAPAEPPEPDPYGQLVAATTGEPLLGPRQADLVDALVARLRAGPPLSEHDVVAMLLLQRVVGLVGLAAR